MIATVLSNDVLIKYLQNRFQRQPISKSTLVMACHYFMKSNCEPFSNRVEKIEEIILDLMKKGWLRKLTDGTITIDIDVFDE